MFNNIIQIGPYALWTVPADWGGNGIPSSDDDDPLGPLSENLDWVEIGPLKQGRRQVLQFGWVPIDWERRGGPKQIVREATPFANVVDLRGVNPEEEVAAFAKAYATELSQLAQLYGSPPEIGWGWFGRECNW